MGLLDRLKKVVSTNETKLVPGVGRVPYPAYRGKEPYIFISYSHQDSETPRILQKVWKDPIGFLDEE